MSNGFTRDNRAVNVIVAPPPGNGLGVAGFVLSLIGLISCGILSPLGFLFSAVGLRKPPRGLAVAGFVLGLLGSLWMLLGGLACVAALLVPNLVGQGERAKIHMAKAVVQRDGPIAQAINLYKFNMDKYPQELRNLIDKPTDADDLKKWGEESYLIAPCGLKDPWDNDYMYVVPGKHNRASYDLWSKGPDGIDGNADDLVNWESGPG